MNRRQFLKRSSASLLALSAAAYVAVSVLTHYCPGISS